MKTDNAQKSDRLLLEVSIKVTNDQMSLLSVLSEVMIMYVILSFDKAEGQCHINFPSRGHLNPLPWGQITA